MASSLESTYRVQTYTSLPSSVLSKVVVHANITSTIQPLLQFDVCVDTLHFNISSIQLS